MSWGYNPAFIFLGPTPEASADNFHAWMNNLVTKYGGPGALVEGFADEYIQGIFQCLGQAEHSRIEGELSRLPNFQNQCLRNHLSAGTYMAIEGAGKGVCQIVPKMLGPFVGEKPP
ncbi:MAG: hypothetical protein A6F71_09390 [Cycloclasticus sp. symbiont of Poecilosclerida sp. M]|nr:MAG: hypothetical protein A6F71_09390 [Cycloclasticus sp. symbiont of Poecilosclerida sp. M]